MPQLPNKNFRLSRLTALLVLVIWLVILGVVALNRQRLFDWWRLRGYQAPAAVVQLANQDTMKAYTRHLFYLNKPQLLSTVGAFRQDCPENQQTIVLGCYHYGQNGIFIYNVSDPSLAGVQQVTAAHEVLHAVYARLSSKARTTLDNELEDYYQHDLTDARVKAEIQIYQQTEPQAVLDEMSCTFGTEIASLPPGLTAYYQQFFTNRSAIVGYEQQYQAEFTSRENTITADDKKLNTMSQSITVQQASLSTQLAQITATKNHLESLLNSGQTSSYNAAVPAYNAAVDSYNSAVTALQSAVNNYNQLVAVRNLVAGQLTTLDQALDTRVPQHVGN